MNYEDVIKRSVSPDSQYDYLFSMPSGKFNETIKLTDEDKKSGVRILCKEQYAQSLYDKFSKREQNVFAKDLTVNTVYDVIPMSVNYRDKLVSCVEKLSGASVFVPISEVKGRVDLTKQTPFKVLLSKTSNGFNYASLKKCERIINFNRLQEYLVDGTDFDVTVKQLVKGGFIATFENSVNCFIPGAHAAANIIFDFNSYLGKTIRVVVDNYDQSSQMFIVSHKKYIKKILPERIHDIKFGEKYKGVLTNNPSKYGIFVEFGINPEYGNIFTGLVHISELTNEHSNLKKGDEVEFYVSRVISDRDSKGFKINLTFDKSKIDEDNIAWQEMKDLREGKTYDFIVEDEHVILTDGIEGGWSISVNSKAFEKAIVNKKKAILSLVDVINKQVGIDFV